MTNYKSQKELIAEIASNLDKLESKKLTVEELEAHVDLVRELHERTIVLRYKIFEEIALRSKEEKGVEETNNETNVEKKTPISEKKETSPVIEKEVVAEPVAELVVELPIIEEPAKTAIIDELPTIDFSLFDEPEENSAEEKITVAVQEEITEEVKSTIVPEPIIPEVEIQDEVELEVEKEAEIPVTIEPEKVQKIEEPIAPKTETKPSSKGFEKKFESVSSEMKGQLGFSKLDTLVGAFGLNERLQYINELFDGSSEKFSEAIKEFDKLPTLNEAKTSCSKFASENNWDVESETVDEFIQKICRKYV